MTIGEGIHLLTDNVGITTNGPRKELCRFEDGEADFAEVEGGEDFTGRLFDLVPKIRFRG